MAFDIKPDDIICISAKSALNINSVIDGIIDRIPPPSGNTTNKTKCVVVDSWFDKYRGVISLISVVDGAIAPGNDYY
jgi:translation elongation factor EF-4